MIVSRADPWCICSRNAYLHFGKINEIPQCAELSQAQHRHDISVLLHRQPYEACARELASDKEQGSV